MNSHSSPRGVIGVGPIGIGACIQQRGDRLGVPTSAAAANRSSLC